jgi:hypothetical protein
MQMRGPPAGYKNVVNHLAVAPAVQGLSCETRRVHTFESNADIRAAKSHILLTPKPDMCSASSACPL